MIYNVTDKGDDGKCAACCVLKRDGGSCKPLNAASDDVLEPISPYRTTEYIGEGDSLPEEEQYW